MTVKTNIDVDSTTKGSGRDNLKINHIPLPKTSNETSETGKISSSWKKKFLQSNPPHKTVQQQSYMGSRGNSCPPNFLVLFLK